MLNSDKIIPSQLQTQLQKGQVIPFVGAGISMSVCRKDNGQSLFPSWKDLLLAAADRLEKKGETKYAKGIRAQMEMGEPQYFLDSARIAKEPSLY